MTKPLAIDLCCGLGGWADGLLAEGWRVIGYDIEAHVYGEHRYPADLVLQDVRTLRGSEIAGARLIVASPPCQRYSYMAMPWTRAKAQAAAIHADRTGRSLAELNELFDACFRIQREACDAAGRHIPMVVENVKGAQPWVGRARWSFGSYFLWGDVPALMPTPSSALKNPGFRLDGSGRSFQSESVDRHVKNDGGSWFAVSHNNMPHSRGDATKNGNDWFGSGADCSLQRRASSKSPARKFASAMIAKIPLALSRHIGSVYRERSSA